MPDPTFLTARAAILLYAVALLVWLRARRPTAAVRLFYTAGCVLLLVHIAVAFHVHHHWSHAAAREHVVEVTRRYTGLTSGAGLWLNYLSAALWVADVIYWWAVGSLRYAARTQWFSAPLQAFLLFMAFNAAVVFAHGTSRLAGATLSALLAVLLFARLSRSEAGPAPPPTHPPPAPE